MPRTRSSPGRGSAAGGDSRWPRAPLHILAATGILAVLVAFVALPAKDVQRRLDRASAVRTAPQPGAPLTSSAAAAAAPSAARVTVARVDPTQAESDDRIMFQLAQLDTAREDEIGRFLERNGHSIRVPRADAQAKLIGSLYRLRGHDNPAVRAGALAAIGRIPGGHFILTEPFLGALADTDPLVRREAVISRTRHGFADFWTFLPPMALDDNAAVRSAVAYALGSVDEPQARAALEGMLRDRSDEVVAAAADAIGLRLCELPMPAVKQMLASNRAGVRLAAVRLLGRFATRDCIGHVTIMLRDPEVEVRHEAIRALGSFEGEPAVEARVRVESVAFDPARTRTERFEALQQLAHTASEPDAGRIHGVAESDPDPALRLAAARSLLARRDKRACRELERLLEIEPGPDCRAGDRDFVRAKAAQTLRDASGAAFSDDDLSSWRKLLPGLEARVSVPEFAYVPERLAAYW